MTTDALFEDPEHFEEGLVHLADMLELADPRRSEAQSSQAKIKKAGVDTPTGESYQEWRAFCMDIISSLKSSRSKLTNQDQLATLDAAIDRLEQLVD